MGWLFKLLFALVVSAQLGVVALLMVRRWLIQSLPLVDFSVSGMTLDQYRARLELDLKRVVNQVCIFGPVLIIGVISLPFDQYVLLGLGLLANAFIFGAYCESVIPVHLGRFVLMRTMEPVYELILPEPELLSFEYTSEYGIHFDDSRSDRTTAGASSNEVAIADGWCCLDYTSEQLEEIREAAKRNAFSKARSEVVRISCEDLLSKLR